VAWLLVWTAVTAGAGVAILRRARYASVAVWTLLVLACLSAFAASRAGSLRGIGILIDMLLFVPLVWFAIWYPRRRHGA
jgi:hypothetical protein